MRLPENWWTGKTSIGVLMFAAALILATPFFVHREAGSLKLRMISTHDLIQHHAVLRDFDKVLGSGVLYPRWLPDINNGYGTPWMNFYPPAFYYCASFLNLLFDNWNASLYALSVLGFLGSGLAFYLLARCFYSKAASLVGALFYMALPYHVINLYWQGAMPQFLGFISLPLIIYFCYRAGSRGRLQDYAGLALCYGTFLLTHAPVSFLVSYTVPLYAVLWAGWDRNWRIVARIATGMFAGLLLGAIYWLPAVLESNQMQEHFSAIFPYHTSYITLLTGYGFTGLVNDLFAIQVVTLAAAALIIRALRPAPHQHETSAVEGPPGAKSNQTVLWIILGIVATFMSTSFSIYISKLLPKIEIVSFAWRWLAISSLFTALVLSAAIDRVMSAGSVPNRRRLVFRAGLALLVIWNIGFSLWSVVGGALSNPPFTFPANYVEAGFTPRNSTVPENLPETPAVVIQPEGGVSEVVRWLPNSREVVVRLNEPSEVRLKSYNFPGWRARIDGAPAAVGSDQDGVQIVSMPAGHHRIEVEFGSTTPRAVGVALSAIGLAAVLAFSMQGYRSRARSRRESDASPEVAGSTTASAGGRRKATIIFATVGAAVLLVVALVQLNSSQRQSRGQTGSVRTDSPSSGNRLRTSITPGAEVRVSVPSATTVTLAGDERTLDELINALSASNKERVEELLQQGKAFRVENNIRARIVDVKPGRVKVRILEGPNTALDCWSPEVWLR
jgi:hypothetical protein